jgi:hypothetical protein
MIYYKVVTRDLRSTIAETFAHGYEVDRNLIIKYEVGKWISPIVEDTKLFAYPSEMMAMMSFGVRRDEHWSRFKVFKCEVENPFMIHRYLVPQSTLFTGEVIRRWWLERRFRTKEPQTFRWLEVVQEYQQIVVGDRIKLLEKIAP